MLISVPQLLYAFFNEYSFENIYNDWYIANYNVIFTGFNIPTIAFTNEDLDP